MIDHVAVKIGDISVSRKFYEDIFAPLGYKVAFAEKGFCAFDIDKGLFELWEEKETVITPVHIAFLATSREHVDAFYSAAMKIGATDNGAPGPRPKYTPNYYAAFVLDPDGHNIEVMHDVSVESLS